MVRFAGIDNNLVSTLSFFLKTPLFNAHIVILSHVRNADVIHEKHDAQLPQLVSVQTRLVILDRQIFWFSV